jgi:hypothetical protein
MPPTGLYLFWICVVELARTMGHNELDEPNKQACGTHGGCNQQHTATKDYSDWSSTYVHP